MVEAGGRLSQAMQAFYAFLGDSDMMAYLAMMAPRLSALRRVMKPSGSIYLHCDPTASHYLKILLDAVFDPGNFRNEIIWQRTLAKGLTSRNLPSNHDVILTYQKSDQSTWNAAEIFTPYNEEELDEKTDEKYSQRDADGRRYQLTSLLNPNPDRPNLTYEFLGVTRVWRWTKERMQTAHRAGLIVQPSPGAVPRFKRYLDEQRGKPLGDVWPDIPPINSRARERLGYPTQKPEALLERIIRLSSNEGDIVLDPFCGCGTTIAAAQKLKRRWIGIDITALAITLIRQRLQDAFGRSAKFQVIGEPVSLPDARALAAQDPFQFQWWALGLVGARPVEQKKGADRGIDGRIYFHDDPKRQATKQVILSVKSGGVSVKDVRDLRGVLDREKAQIGVLITLEEATKPMRAEAAGAGFYDSPFGGKHARLQVTTIKELLDGRRIDYPPSGQQVDVTFKRAPASALPRVAEPRLPLGESEEE